MDEEQKERIDRQIDQCMTFFNSLSMAGYSLRSLRGFFRFYQMRQDVPVSYNFLIRDEADRGETFMTAFDKAMNFLNPAGFHIFRVTEANLLQNRDMVMKKISEEPCALLIDKCKEGAMSETDRKNWSEITEAFSGYPHIVKILCAPEEVIRTRFYPEEHLYYRVFRNHIVFRKMDEKEILRILFSMLRKDGYTWTDSFYSLMGSYTDAVYKNADLQEDQFVRDLYERIVTAYFQFNEKLDCCLDESCVPYYSGRQEAIRALHDQSGSEPVPELVLGSGSGQQPSVMKIPHIDDSGTPAADTGDHKNILLLALSTFPGRDLQDSFFSFSEAGIKKQSYVYQMEPVPEMLMERLAEKKQRLDEIVILSTSKAVKRVIGKKYIRDNQVYTLQLEDEEGISPFEYFKYRLHEYSAKYDYSPAFKCFEINAQNESAGDKQSANPESRNRAVQNAMRSIIEELRANIREQKSVGGVSQDGEGDRTGQRTSKRVRLFMDIHGGLRDQQEILTTVISLLRYDEEKMLKEQEKAGGKRRSQERFLDPDGVYTVEYNAEQHISEIMHVADTLTIQNFAAGIHEVMNYARTDSLDFYHAFYVQEYEEKLITIMKNLAQSIQLMDIVAFEKWADQLNRQLGSYQIRRGNEQDSGSYLSMFLGNIRDSYAGLLVENRTVIDEIKWCMEKGFYQQALTLIESKMPEFYLDHHLLDFGDDILDKLRSTRKDNRLSNELNNAIITSAVQLNNAGKERLKQTVANQVFNRYVKFLFLNDMRSVLMNRRGQKDIDETAVNYRSYLRIIYPEGTGARNGSGRSTSSGRQKQYYKGKPLLSLISGTRDSGCFLGGKSNDHDQLKVILNVPNRELYEIFLYHVLFKTMRNFSVHVSVAQEEGIDIEELSEMVGDYCRMVCSYQGKPLEVHRKEY